MSHHTTIAPAGQAPAPLAAELLEAIRAVDPKCGEIRYTRTDDSLPDHLVHFRDWAAATDRSTVRLDLPVLAAVSSANAAERHFVVLPPTTEREAARRARVEAIRDGARVRRALSQGALHEFTGGVHTITWQGERYHGATVDDAIRAAQEAEK